MVNKKSWKLLLTIAGAILTLCTFSALGASDVTYQSGGGSKASVSSENGSINVAWSAFPQTVTSKSKAKLLIQREVPDAVTPGNEYTYVIKVSNGSYYKIDKVVIIEKLPSNFELAKAFPKPQLRGNELRWNLGMMAPGQKETFIITGKAKAPGVVKHRGVADLDFNLGQMTTIMEVVEPQLMFKVEAPANAVVFETIPVKLMFRNPGSAPVLGARLAYNLPNGIKTLKGNSTISLPIGDIMPNAVKNYNLKLRANKVGVYETKLVAVAKDGIKANADMKIVVGKPNLMLTANAPKKRFVGNKIRYKMELKNSGNSIARDVTAKMNFPNGVVFNSANEGGRAGGNMVNWKLGSLEPGEQKTIEAVLVGTKIMTLRTSIVADSKGSSPLTKKMVTNVDGIPALLLELSDINDPVFIGETETYVIKVSNQGSLAAKNVVISCDLEDSMEYVRSTGPTIKRSLAKWKLVFRPLASLAPNSVATWRVTVKALKEGDVRFRVNLMSDHLTRPAYENESTNFYK